jgi:hypothetical protein
MDPGEGLMRKLSPMVVVAALVVSMLHGVVPAARAGTGRVTYLALGDSLATRATGRSRARSSASSRA